MWQEKSLIPKPRLRTPLRVDTPSATHLTPNPPTPSRNPPRNPPRTPSRIPRPAFQSAEDTSAVQTTTTPLSHSNPRMKRGDTLAEHVIATGIISSHNSTQTANKTHSSCRSNRLNSFRSAQFSHDDPEPQASDKRNEAVSTCSPFRTPTKQLTASHIPGTHLSTPSRPFATPDQIVGSRDADRIGVEDELIIDEELITRTPAKHRNTEWLASFGIDISLLNITEEEDDEENHDPNSTPSPDTMKTHFETNLSQPRSKPSTAYAFRRRCATDFYVYAHSARESHSGLPVRMRSARKTRRASARISVRELDALKCDESNVEAKRVETEDIRKGSDVFLTPVRATRRQREKNGTPVVLSEVRRSLRINTPSSKLVPKNSVRGRIELLEANDHSYIPNPTLSDRAALSG